MKIAFVFFFVVAAAVAAPNQKEVTILRNDNDVGIDGYKFGFETSDGTSRQEQGELKNAGTDNEALVVKGTVSWVAPDGTKYTLTYIADENGFQPQGDHLPKAP